MGERTASCRITVDTYRCNSCESCVVLCPELFRMSEASGKAEAVNDVAPCSEELHRAAAICAEKCIEVEPI
ncbi:MAG: ferredoxin [Desulfobulbaceae bacterium]|nr:ferredoxin [Desulfobulbaceae bacterium]